jgi:plasmid maintenance system antidote protein VapI
MLQINKALPTHPGELVADEIKYAGMTIEDASEKMGLPIDELKSLVDCKIPISKKVCEKVSCLFNLECDMLLKLQSDRDNMIMAYNLL